MFNHIREMVNILFFLVLIVIILLRIDCNHVVIFILHEKLCWGIFATRKNEKVRNKPAEERKTGNIRIEGQNIKRKRTE